MTIIDGKSLASKIKANLKEKVNKLSPKPGLAVVLVGDNPASKIYVASKEKACAEIGYYSQKIVLPKETTQEELNRVITKLNNDKKIHGILVQLPLPQIAVNQWNSPGRSRCAPPSRWPAYPESIREGLLKGVGWRLSEEETIRQIKPEKDVDGLSPINMGKLFGAKKYLPELLVPATPKGVMTLIKSTGVSIEGKNAVVIGRSNLVGKPVALLLLYENATVIVCHSKTVDLPEITRRADILVVAIGKPKTITANMVKKGAIVIDVGINRILCLPEVEPVEAEGSPGDSSPAKPVQNDERKNYTLVGDVDFEMVKEVAGYITPVPGGVGPMTITSLMENTLIAFLNQMKA